MDDSLRAQVVAALRAEADCIEAGGETKGWAVDYDGHECAGLVGGCRKWAADALDRLVDEASGWGEWHPDTDRIAWGVRVTVEAARVVDRYPPTYTGHGCDEIAEYELVDPRAHQPPPLGNPHCANCDEQRPCTLTDEDGYWCAECLADEETPCTES